MIMSVTLDLFSVVTLDNAKKRNSLSAALINELELMKTRGIRCLILRAGRFGRSVGRRQRT